MDDADEQALAAAENVELIAEKTSALIEEARSQLNGALDMYDYAEASVAASALLSLLRVRQRVWELQ